MPDLHPPTAVGVTLYKEVKRQLLADLSAGEWQPGEVVPSEKQLCLRFGVSIGTLRKAIDELVAENILIRHQGRGTFVATHGRDQHLFRFFNVVRHDGQKTYPKLTLTAFVKARADKATCDKLGIASSAKTFHFTNLLSLNDEPVQVDEITLPEALFAGLSAAQLRNRPSTLYSLYQVAYGLNVIRIEERVRATLAGARTRETAQHPTWYGTAADLPNCIFLQQSADRIAGIVCQYRALRVLPDGRPMSVFSVWHPAVLRKCWPGIAIASVIALAATFVSDSYGGPQMLYALFFGLAFHFLARDPVCQPGIEFSSRTILRTGVALLGARITFDQIASLGVAPIAMVLCAVAATLLFGWLLARRLRPVQR